MLKALMEAIYSADDEEAVPHRWLSSFFFSGNQYAPHPLPTPPPLQNKGTNKVT